MEHRTFAGSEAVRRGQPVLYVTERCVFRLGADGLELTEIAPGVDLERDILARMDFAPVIRGEPRLMDPAIFRPEPMGLRERMLAVPLEQRLAYDDEHNILFLNFERLSVKTSADVKAIHAEIEHRLKLIGHKVYGIVNYDHFDLDPQVEDEYAAMRAFPAGCLRIQEIDHAPKTTAARPQSRASANPDILFSLSRRDVQQSCNGFTATARPARAA